MLRLGCYAVVVMCCLLIDVSLCCVLVMVWRWLLDDSVCIVWVVVWCGYLLRVA